MSRIPCTICNKKTVLKHSFNDLILVNNFSKDKKKYPLDLHYCSDCDLFRLGYLHPDKDLYSNYLYTGEHNPDKIKLIKELYESEYKNISSVLEIGGGDGYLSELFVKNKCLYKNFDPTSSDAPFNVKEFFVGQDTNKYDLIIVSNVLAHISDPKTLIENLKKNIHKNSKIIILVQNGEWVINEGILDYIFHEHKYYYTQKSFKAILSDLNLQVHKVKIHGESLLGTNIQLNKKIEDDFVIKKKRYRFRHFNESIRYYNKNLQELSKKIISQKQKVVGIGCGPRTIKILFDLDKEAVSKISLLIEPKNSKKLNLIVPYLNVKITHEDEKEASIKNTVIWFPWHIKVPLHLNEKNIIIPFSK